MGRIGAGEFSTMLLAVAGPLIHLAIAFALIFWGRRLMRTGKSRLAAYGFYAAAGGLLAMLLGLLATILGLIRSFGAVASVDPSGRAMALSEGISAAMWGTAIGVAGSIVLYGLSFVLLVLAARARPLKPEP